MMRVVRSFCKLGLLRFGIHVCCYDTLISGGNEPPTTWLPFLARYILATDGSLAPIIFTLLQKYLLPGRRYLLESTSPEFIMIQCEIHCPLLPTPSRTGMKCALNWSEIHHMRQQWALALPLFLVWNRYTIFPPDLFRDLHCSFHAEQQLLWTVWVCHSSQMILSFCLKLVLITKARF